MVILKARHGINALINSIQGRVVGKDRVKDPVTAIQIASNKAHANIECGKCNPEENDNRNKLNHVPVVAKTSIFIDFQTLFVQHQDHMRNSFSANIN